MSINVKHYLMSILQKNLLSSICLAGAFTLGTALNLETKSQVVPTPQAPLQQVPSLDTIQAPGEVLTEVSLYFGLAKPGGVVSETEWQAFLAREITPRFREGLTVLDAYGQYLDHDGTLIRENTKLVILIYANSPEKEADVQAIVDTYKQAFHQESVLRTSSLIKAAF